MGKVRATSFAGSILYCIGIGAILASAHPCEHNYGSIFDRSIFPRHHAREHVLSPFSPDGQWLRAGGVYQGYGFLLGRDGRYAIYAPKEVLSFRMQFHSFRIRIPDLHFFNDQTGVLQGPDGRTYHLSEIGSQGTFLHFYSWSMDIRSLFIIPQSTISIATKDVTAENWVAIKVTERGPNDRVEEIQISILGPVQDRIKLYPQGSRADRYEDRFEERWYR